MNPFEALAPNTLPPKSSRNAEGSRVEAEGERRQEKAFEDVMGEKPVQEKAPSVDNKVEKRAHFEPHGPDVRPHLPNEELGEATLELPVEVLADARIKPKEDAAPKIGEDKLDREALPVDLRKGDSPDADPVPTLAPVQASQAAERPSVQNEIAAPVAKMAHVSDGESALAPKQFERFVPQTVQAVLSQPQAAAAPVASLSVAPVAATTSLKAAEAVPMAVQEEVVRRTDVRQSGLLETQASGAHEKVQPSVAELVTAPKVSGREGAGLEDSDAELPLRVESRAAAAAISNAPQMGSAASERPTSFGQFTPQGMAPIAVESFANGGMDVGLSQEGSHRDLRTAMAATAPLRTPAIVAGAMPQLVAQITSGQAKVGSGEIEIRLDPPELGRVRISFSGVEGAMTGLVVAERGEVDALMRRNAEQLADALAEAGFEDVTLQFGTPEGSDEADFQQSGEEPMPAAGLRSDVDLLTSDEAALSGVAHDTGETGLDIRL